ncbi:MAG TPA: DUF1232 domain-containing protein [Beijerinckiaceae bacterium]|jgi:uncharacterized membrane protein YkvA (DUF1232 family)
MDETIDGSFSRPFTKDEIERMRAMGGAAAERAEAGPDGAPDEAFTRRFWRKVRRVGRRLPFAEDLVAAYLCTLDPATPRRVKLTLLGALAYFVLPLDALPDLLPFLGFADDAALLGAALAQVAGSITPAHREKAREILDEETPTEAEVEPRT